MRNDELHRSVFIENEIIDNIALLNTYINLVLSTNCRCIKDTCQITNYPPYSYKAKSQLSKRKRYCKLTIMPVLLRFCCFCCKMLLYSQLDRFLSMVTGSPVLVPELVSIFSQSDFSFSSMLVWFCTNLMKMSLIVMFNQQVMNISGFIQIFLAQYSGILYT